MLWFLAWLLRLLLVLVALFWLGTALNTFKKRRDSSFRISLDDPPLEGEIPGVSVIVPVRNEEANIGACLRSILGQDHAPLEVVIFDDSSTDGTVAVVQGFLSDSRLRLIQGSGEPPQGWKGKPWALQRAQAEATQPWLLFVDADVQLHPRAVSRALAYAVRNQVHLLSGFGALEAASFWERTLQPVIGGLIVAGNDLGQVNDLSRVDKVIANGQFLLFRREAYDAIGGHGAVKDEVVDDVNLARVMKRAGRLYHCVFMRTLFACRMYRSFGEIWRGWRKNLFIGIHGSWRVLLGVTGFLFVEALLPYLLTLLGAAGIIGIEWAVWGASLVLIIHLVRLYLDQVFGQPRIYGFTQPLAMLLVILLFWDSALSSGRGRILWKGRLVA